MANMVLDEDGQPPNYLNLKPLAVTIFMRSLNRVQQERSYFESLVQKEDIFDTKNQFKENVIRFINEENERTEHLYELIDAVVSRIKDWIKHSKPKIQVLEGPFCLYAYKYCLLEDQTYQRAMLTPKILKHLSQLSLERTGSVPTNSATTAP